jgi:hypothetical protein
MIAPLRRGRRGAGDPDTLAFTAGELVRAAVGFAADAELVEEIERRGLLGSGCDAQIDVIEGRQGAVAVFVGEGDEGVSR